jgi:hypothetical protein
VSVVTASGTDLDACGDEVRVLLWATTLQADILALAYHLDQRRDCSLLIVTEHADSFLKSPIARLRPIAAPLLDRSARNVEATALQFKADVVVCDNHFPKFEAAPRVCAMWHGLGWKARASTEVQAFFGNVKKLTGLDARAPNPRFLAQCYHARDFEWRTAQWGIAPENCRVTGSCFADLLQKPAPEYGLDLSRKTVLVNITWHYGRIFPGSWQRKLLGTAAFEEDMEFLRELIHRMKSRGVNLLFCLHDSKRYEAEYLAAMQRLLAESPDGISVRHKDHHPDNWADLSVGDVMISNLSSFSTFFYHSGRPVVHLCPPEEEGDISFAQYSWFGLHRRLRKSSMPRWMNSPNDNGGITASTASAAFEALDTALENPDCCRERSKRWIDTHLALPEPSASECLASELQRLARA